MLRGSGKSLLGLRSDVQAHGFGVAQVLIVGTWVVAESAQITWVIWSSD